MGKREARDLDGGGIPWTGGGSPSRKRAAYGFAALAGTVAVAFTLAFLALSSAPVAEVAPQPAAQEAPEEAADRSEWFLGAENFAFLSESGLRAFERECYSWLLAQGMDEGRYVYCCAEDVASEGSTWRAYVRTPHDARYYLVTYDVDERSFSFEPCAEPPSVAERQKHADESEAALAAAPEGDADEGASRIPEGGTDLSEADPSPYDASRNIPVTDASALSEHLPDAAASSLSGAVAEYAAMRGFSTAPEMCSVYPDSFRALDGKTAFEVLCFAPDRSAVRLSVEYDPAIEMFGMSLI